MDITETTTEIAETILRQLGGILFVRMTGAKNFLAIGQGLIFTLPRSGFNRKGINRVHIELDVWDTYRVRFLKVRGLETTTVAEYEGVYCDQLRGIFTKETGLYTSL